MPRRALIVLLVTAQQLGQPLPQPFHTPWYRKATRVDDEGNCTWKVSYKG